MVQQPTLMKRLERHHRIDGNLQARARPIMYERKSADDENTSNAAQQIRSWVEENGVGQEKRADCFLGFCGSDDSGSSSSSGSGSSGSSSSSGGGDSGSGSGTGGSRGTSGSSSGSSSDDGGDSSGSGGKGADSSSASSASTTSTTHRGGLLGGLFGGDDKTSTTSSSSSTTSSTRTSTTSSRITTSTLTSSSSTPLLSTSVAYVTSTPLTSFNNAAATASPTETGSSGPGVGPIIGIVAGALAGVAILAVVIGFLIKKFGRKEDPYETDPFDRDSFRRQSAMLPDTFDDDHNPEMSEAYHSTGPSGPFGDENAYAGAGAMAAGAGAATAFSARNDSGGPRPPTIFQDHMNGPAAQLSMSDAPPVPTVGAIYTAGHDPSPQLPPMAFGGSDPYSIAGVGRHHLDNNINNPYGYLDRQYSGSHPPQSQGGDRFVETQEYANLDRHGSQGSATGMMQQQPPQQYPQYEEEGHSNYDHHDTAGRPGTAEGRSGTPDLPNMQQTYAMAGNNPEEQHSRVTSPHRMVTSPQHLSQDYLTNGMALEASNNGYHSARSESPSPPQQPLQVRNLLPNPYAQQQGHQQRPISAVSSNVDDDAAYGGVW